MIFKKVDQETFGRYVREHTDPKLDKLTENPVWLGLTQQRRTEWTAYTPDGKIAAWAEYTGGWHGVPVKRVYWIPEKIDCDEN